MPPSDSPPPCSLHAALRAVSCRRLWPSDGAAVRAFFLRLDAETRARRFRSAVSDRMAESYAERAMVARGTMFGVYVDGSLRALGEMRPLGAKESGTERSAEVALVVERGFRRAGFGSLLLRRLSEAARNRGIAALRLHCLPYNAPMRRLAARLGADLRVEGGESAGAIRLARATPLSLWREGIEDCLDFGLAAAACSPPPFQRAA